MQWSKLKGRVKSFIAPNLRKRVDFHVTSYRRSHDEAEKAWVTIDGKIAFVASWYRHQWAGDSAEELELHRPQQFGDALRKYLELKLEDAISDADPFIRGLAFLDRRMGPARVERLRPSSNEHSFVKVMHKLRASSDSTEAGRKRKKE